MKPLTLYRKYYQHQHNARCRGVEFLFTFEEWVEWWGDDIVLRGKTKNGLVMARFGDTGPYAPWNVRKATVAENVSEGQKNKPKSEEQKQKMRKPKSEEHKRNLSKSVKKTLASKKII